MRKQLSQPSFTNGFARSKSESVRPDLWDGLIGFWVPALGVQGGVIYNIADAAKSATCVADYTWSRDNVVLGIDTTNKNRISMGLNWHKILLANPFTFFVDYTPLNNRIGKEVVIAGAWRIGNSSVNQFVIGGNYYSTVTDYYPFFGIDTAVGRRYAVHTTPWTVGVREILFGTRNGTNLKLYRGGNLVGIGGTDTNPITSNATSDAVPLAFGSLDSNASYNTNASYRCCGLWTRELTRQQILDLTADPLLPLRRKKQWSMYVPSTPSGVVLPVFMNHYRNQRIA